MHMLYNSDSFSVVQFEPSVQTEGVNAAEPGAPLIRGGFEIVDKFARKEIFIEGELAERFMAGVQALIDESPTEEALDEYIGRFSPLMQQPLVLH